MTPRLDPGQYLGGTVRSRQQEGLRLTLCAYQPSRHWARHTHENPGLLLLVSGQHREKVVGNEYVQPPASLLFHPTTVPHATETGPEGMLGLNISYSRSWLESLGIEEWSLGGVPSLVDSHDSRRIAFRLLAATFGSSRFASAELENEALDLLSSLGDVEPPQCPKWLLRLRDQIHAEFSTQLRVSKLAAAASYDPAYVCRAFKNQFRCSITDYIQVQRLSKAIGLIAHGVPIGDAAADAGFSDHAHLCRISNRWMGLAPGAIWPRPTRESHERSSTLGRGGS